MNSYSKGFRGSKRLHGSGVGRSEVDVGEVVIMGTNKVEGAGPGQVGSMSYIDNYSCNTQGNAPKIKFENPSISHTSRPLIEPPLMHLAPRRHNIWRIPEATPLKPPARFEGGVRDRPRRAVVVRELVK